MQEFIQAVKSKNISILNIEKLENITNEYPYFHLAKVVLLKKYYEIEHFKYNVSLKNVAAHSVDREVLFHYINNIEDTKTIIPDKPETNEVINTPIVKEEIVKIIPEEKPFNFNKSERHSFNQWLQLTPSEPISRREDKGIEQKISPKLNIIDRFIENNPKISPIKRTPSPVQSLKKNNNDISNELMTETLAKVYIAQKKYDNAIQAFKILSLKYPEKSSLFADQIQRIKTLQNNKL